MQFELTKSILIYHVEKDICTGKFLFQIKESFPVPIKDKQDLQHGTHKK